MILSKAYNPQDVEDTVYAKWEKSGFFNPDTPHPTSYKLHPTSYFSIAMPPPNATGELHIGHAMGLALQDLMTRYNRMKGKASLWIPGPDHAIISRH